MLHHVHYMKKHYFKSESFLEIFNHVINIDYFITMNHFIINILNFFQKSDIFSSVFDKKHL